MILTKNQARVTCRNPMQNYNKKTEPAKKYILKGFF